jgi:hypothetical protein
VFIPGGCTGELQPLDLSGNAQDKYEVKKEFTLWYADLVQRQLDKGTDVEKLVIDLKLSTIKPVHAKWMINAFEKIEQRKVCLFVCFILRFFPTVFKSYRRVVSLPSFLDSYTSTRLPSSALNIEKT